MLRSQKYTSILLLIIISHLCSAYKILVVFPLPGKSHTILGDAFVQHLLKAGHEITYITPIPIKNETPGLRQVDVSLNFNAIATDQFLNIEKIMTKEVDLTDMLSMFNLMISIANNTLMNENVQQLLHDPNEKFDAVIIEWMYNELYSGFASVFDCPLIWSSSMDPHYLVLSIIDEDLHPAYTADIVSNKSPPFTFIERVSQLVSYVQTRIYKWWTSSIENEVFEKAYSSAVAKRGRQLLPLSEVKYNGSLMFGNSHVSSGQAIRLPQNYVPIAGYHVDSDIKQLPKNLQKIMDEAKHGVIYFSMGSMLKSTHIPTNLKKDILNVFSQLKQTVIWKFEEQLDNLPRNVHIVHWAPQQSILAHPNCDLFITHGGLLSTIETLHFGVPIIGIPMFADQFNNVNRAVNKGFAKRVDFNLQTPVNLKAAIDDILGSPRFRERVKELSFVYHHRPIPPAAELVHWVEHVVRTRGALHIRSPALLVRWYQKIYLDLFALLLAFIVVITYIIKLFVNKTDSVNVNKKLN